MTLMTTSPRSQFRSGHAATSCARSWWRRWVGFPGQVLLWWRALMHHFGRASRLNVPPSLPACSMMHGLQNDGFAPCSARPPAWHAYRVGPLLFPTLQTYVDPDEIFQQHQKTCSLDEVFANGEHGHGTSGRGTCLASTAHAATSLSVAVPNGRRAFHATCGWLLSLALPCSVYEQAVHGFTSFTARACRSLTLPPSHVPCACRQEQAGPDPAHQQRQLD